jgi:hypothetical protein
MSTIVGVRRLKVKIEKYFTYISPLPFNIECRVTNSLDGTKESIQ